VIDNVLLLRHINIEFNWFINKLILIPVVIQFSLFLYANGIKLFIFQNSTVFTSVIQF